MVLIQRVSLIVKSGFPKTKWSKKGVHLRLPLFDGDGAGAENENTLSDGTSGSDAH